MSGRPERDPMPPDDAAGDADGVDDPAQADFAAEHDDTTFADDTPGVPRAKEPGSPSGRGGDGGMDPP